MLLFILFAGFCYIKIQEERYLKYARHDVRNEEGFVDYYEILQLDTSASSNDIKSQYKKLAVIWHPDKNPNCESCQKKFQDIGKAYEILGNPLKRKSYDENSMVISQITSLAVTLNEQNFERLVEDSNDIWIIQVYEDGDGYCEHIAKMWDEIVSKLSPTIKFGRINNTQKRILKKLPFNIVLLPTIFSWVEGEVDIYTLDDEDFITTLKSFIRSKTPKIMENYDLSRYMQLMNQSEVQQKVDIIFTTQDSTHLATFNALAIKYRKYINIYNNQKSEFQKILNHQGLTQYPVSVIYNHNNKRITQSFSFKNNVVSKFDLKNIINYAKYNIIPEVFSNNFVEFCENKGQKDNHDDSVESMQTMCILLIKQKDQAKQRLLEEKVFEFMDYHIEDINNKIASSKKIFDQYNSFQFVWIDLNKHPKFKQILTDNIKKNLEDDLQNIPAIALLAENKKISYLKKLNNIEDWLEYLLEASSSIQYSYLNEETDDHEINNFLIPENYSLLNSIVRSLRQNILDPNFILASFLLFWAFIFLNIQTDYQVDKIAALHTLIVHLSLTGFFSMYFLSTQ